MRAETRRRLERTLRRERAKKAAAAAAALAMTGLLFLYEDLDARVEDVRVPGTVAAVGPLNVRSTRLVEAGLSVDVALDSGQHVTVMALRATDPHVGDHVEITRHRHRTGRVTYSWR